MKIKNKININDIYFGMVMPKMSYSSNDSRGELGIYNLFDITRVKRAVALYVTMNEELRKEIENPIYFCFSDVRGRAEYEFMMCPWPYRDGDFVEQVGSKIDMFSMYIEPNAELLMDLVGRVTITSAKKYLSEERKKYKR